jgi:hypothetical protein
MPLTSLLYHDCALASVGKVRIGSVREAEKWPTFCEKLHAGLPAFPCFVVMMTTPADAFEP